MVVLRRAMLGAGTHRDPVLSILSGDDHPEVQLICARPITSSLEPGVRILHRPCRPLLRGLEQAHRAALDDHVHRPTRLGQWVLIMGSWYSSGTGPDFPGGSRSWRVTSKRAASGAVESPPTPTSY